MAPQVEPLEQRLHFSAYFVSPTGNDAAAGTSSAPWKTIQHSVPLVHAGDVVNVRSGTYSGFILGWDGPINGTAVAPITFQAEPGVVINLPNNKTRDGIGIEACSFVTIEGFTIQPKASEAAFRSGIRFGGGGTGNVARGNHAFMRAQDTMGIFSSFNTDQLVENNEVSGNHDAGIYCSNSAVRPTVRNNYVHDLSLSTGQSVSYNFNGDLSQGGSGIVKGATITGNYAYNCQTGLSMDGVQNSTITGNVFTGITGKGAAFFKQDGAAESTGNTFTGNFIIGNSSRASLQTHSGGSVFKNNVLVNWGGPAIENDAATSSTITGNIYRGTLIGATASLNVKHIAGDTNFDGHVTRQDYAGLDSSLSAVGFEGWFGDTNGDGKSTAQDYSGIDANLGS
jgi:parallel beta-helix repeat protein